MKGIGIIAAAGGAMLGAYLVRRAQYAKAYAVIEAEHVMTIRKPADELYSLWMKRDQWWQWMRPVLDAEIARGTENEILFRAPKLLEGSVIFTELDTGRGTEVRVRVRHVPRVMPMRMLRDGYSGLEPTNRIKEDLRRFKQLAETGEVASNESPSARKPSKTEVGSTVKRVIDTATTVKNTTIERGV